MSHTHTHIHTSSQQDLVWWVITPTRSPLRPQQTRRRQRSLLSPRTHTASQPASQSDRQTDRPGRQTDRPRGHTHTHTHTPARRRRVGTHTRDERGGEERWTKKENCRSHEGTQRIPIPTGRHTLISSPTASNKFLPRLAVQEPYTHLHLHTQRCLSLTHTHTALISATHRQKHAQAREAHV